ncbi:MAG: hypothetical protein IJS53_04395 [Clostridia bacterium]|nr:hypothetical protein [Clostridia bacterium]
MHQIKKLCAILALTSCLTAAALADGVPASQFGFKGWPYRNRVCSPTAAVSPAATASPTQRPAATARPQATATPVTGSDVGDYTTLSVSAQEYSAWNLLNQDRQTNGLAALPLDEELCAIARVKSCDMKQNHYFAHESPTYGRAADMLKYFGYSYRGVGENIAHHANIEKAEAAFMSSTGHRQNILGSQWTRVGIGICYDDNGFIYLTQIFAR